MTLRLSDLYPFILSETEASTRAGHTNVNTFEVLEAQGGPLPRVNLRLEPRASSPCTAHSPCSTAVTPEARMGGWCTQGGRLVYHGGYSPVYHGGYSPVYLRVLYVPVYLRVLYVPVYPRMLVGRRVYPRVWVGRRVYHCWSCTGIPLLVMHGYTTVLHFLVRIWAHRGPFLPYSHLYS